MRRHPTSPDRAWETHLDGVGSIVRAGSRSAARAATIRSAREAGYHVPFTAPMRVRRRADLDEADVPKGSVLSVEYVEGLVRAVLERLGGES